MIEIDGLYIGKIRFYVSINICENPNDTCDCEEMRQQLQAQMMGWC